MSKPTFLGPLIGKGAGQCELVYAERGTVLASYVEPAFDSKTRKRGLLGRESIPADYALVIAPCSAVHTFAMRVPIDLAFVKKDGTIAKTYRGVKPWRMAGSLGAYAVIEAAEGFIDRHELVPGDVVALRETAGGSTAAETPVAAGALSGSGFQPSVASVPPIEPGSVPSRRITRKRLTLAEVVATKPPLAWFESVAIVQELCETILARGPADDLRVPELKHIMLTAEGRVTLLAEGPSGHSAVQRAGLVLLALTPEEQMPMQLRLLVLEEVSPRPRLKSLQDMHRELEFYERPDRPSICREVYERVQRQSDAPAVAPVIPESLLEPPPPKRHHHWWRHKRVWTGCLLAVLAFVAVGLIWVWPRPEGQRLRSQAEQLSRISQTAGRDAFKAVRRELDAARSRFRDKPREPQPGVLVLADAEPQRTPELGQNITLDAGASAPDLPPIQLATTPLSGETERPETAPNPRMEPRAPTPESARGSVFSIEDTQVVPPRLMSPQSVTKSIGAAAGGAPEAELLVSAAGEVESVKLLSGPTTALTGGQISSIKAWRFEPATRNGQPVRYRLRVRVPAQ